jgi:hypothetical protein
VKRLTFAIVASIGMMGCATGETTQDNSIPPGWKAYTTAGNYRTYVIPVTMDDGTKCVVVTKNSSGGAGVSCNWK